MNTMVPFLWVAGGVQLAIAIANLWVPGILHYRENLAKLPPMARQVFMERVMTIPLISAAQVRIIAEGVTEAIPPCGPLPPELLPAHCFSEEQIIKGLPLPASFGCADLCCFNKGGLR